MKAVVSLLLCLISALMEVHSQTIPYVSFMGTNLPNHSYVDLTLVGTAAGSSVQCHTDLSTCCSAAQGPDRGDWYFPNGDRLQFSNGPDDIYEQRRAQRVDLRRRNNGDTSGIYRCIIDTNAVNDDDGRETVYAGLYASGGEYTEALEPHRPGEFFSESVVTWISLQIQGVHAQSPCRQRPFDCRYGKRLAIWLGTKLVPVASNNTHNACEAMALHL